MNFKLSLALKLQCCTEHISYFRFHKFDPVIFLLHSLKNAFHMVYIPLVYFPST